MYQAVMDPIPDSIKQEILNVATQKTPAHDEGKLGLIYLDNDRMLEIFAPYMEKHFEKKTKFLRCWVHWMKDGGSRPRHQHSQWTYLYYLDIPQGDSGNIVFDDGELKPVEGTHIMFPGRTYHSIKANNTDKVRWAFAANCEP